MRVGKDAWGNYYMGKFSVYDTYTTATDINGNKEEGYCWCVVENLDSKDILLVSKNFEDILEYCLDNQ